MTDGPWSQIGPIITHTWLTHFFKFASAHDIMIHDALPKLLPHRPNDLCLMDAFLAGPNFTDDLRMLLAWRQYYDYICLSDTRLCGTAYPSTARLEPVHRLTGVLTWHYGEELLPPSLFQLATGNCDSLTKCGSPLRAHDGASSFWSPKIDSSSNRATCGNPTSTRRAASTNGSTTERFACITPAATPFRRTSAEHM
jgi:hypothetical protein